MGSNKRYVVQESRQSPYSEPIALKKGEVVTVGEEYKGEALWPGWIWCETGSTKCWVPYQIIQTTDKQRGILKEDYIATELNVQTGETVEAERELNGWVWARKLGSKEFGWIPIDILKQVDA